MRLITLALPLSLLFAGCAFHSTATEWNGRVGPDGEPVYVKSSTSVGLNLFILLKIVGGTNTPGLIDEVTKEIAAENGDHVRMVESSTENYWYGFPPFTWIITPVISTVTAEYRPHESDTAPTDGETTPE